MEFIQQYVIPPFLSSRRNITNTIRRHLHSIHKLSHKLFHHHSPLLARFHHNRTVPLLLAMRMPRSTFSTSATRPFDRRRSSSRGKKSNSETPGLPHKSLLPSLASANTSTSLTRSERRPRTLRLPKRILQPSAHLQLHHTCVHKTRSLSLEILQL
jgi:hypothetical protein